jgi:diguanylate cyclase (GGDEF)-like protein
MVGVETEEQVDGGLARQLEQLLASADFTNVVKLDRAIQKLSDKEGPAVFQALMEKLFALSLSETDAMLRWNELVAHHREIAHELTFKLDFRATSLDYLVRKTRLLSEPVLVDRQRLGEMQRNIVSDGMTGLYNFRYFEQSLSRELTRAKRYNAPLSLLFFDIDHFKTINDRLGHLAGDEVLRKVADVISGAVRSTDFACRYGGEEFAVIVPQTGRAGALLLAERIRVAVEKLKILKLRNQGLHLTISGGVSTLGNDGSDAEELIRAADQALYTAKSLGRNQVVAADSEQRHQPRIPAEVPVVFSAGLDHKEASRTKNVSDRGLLLLSNGPLAIGEIVHLEVAIRSDQQPVRCTGSVTHIHPQGTGLYEIGVCILHVSASDQGRYHAFVANRAA